MLIITQARGHLTDLHPRIDEAVTGRRHLDLGDKAPRGGIHVLLEQALKCASLNRVLSRCMLGAKWVTATGAAVWFTQDGRSRNIQAAA